MHIDTSRIFEYTVSPYLPNLVYSLLLSLPTANEWLGSRSNSQSTNGIYQSITSLQFFIVHALGVHS